MYIVQGLISVTYSTGHYLPDIERTSLHVTDLSMTLWINIIQNEEDKKQGYFLFFKLHNAIQQCIKQ